MNINSKEPSYGFLSGLLDSVLDPILVMDKRGRIVAVNRAGLDLLGYKEGELVGRTLEDITGHRGFLEERDLRMLLSVGEARNLRVNLLKKSGEEVPVSLNVSMFHADGQHFIVAVARDIREVLELEQRFHSIVSSLSEGLAVIVDNKIVYMNPALETLLGIGYPQIRGEFCDLLPLEERQKTSEAYERVLRGEEAPPIVVRFVKADGCEKWLRLSGTRVSWFGRPAIAVIITDLTETELLRRRLQGTLNQVVLTLSRIVEYRDPYTAGHQQRVAGLSLAIAERMGLRQEQREGLRIAALLHDIGKLAVPVEILSKPGRLNEHEFELVKTHPAIGYRILSEIDFPWPVAEVVYQHHERLDGSGYPRGLRGEEILLEARIIGVADVTEAMLNHRPYRPAYPLGEVIEELTKNKGILYDPDVVEVCTELLSTGEFSFSQIKAEPLIQPS